MSMNTRHYVGTQGTATGVVGLYPAGLPAHMLPSATRLDAGSGSAGEQRVTAEAYVGAAGVPKKRLQATITGTATVQLEGTNGDPTGSPTWSLIGTALTATGLVTDDYPYAFVRVNKTTGTGTVAVGLVLEE